MTRQIVALAGAALVVCGCSAGAGPAVGDTDVADEQTEEVVEDTVEDTLEDTLAEDTVEDVETEAECGDFFCDEGESCVECPTDCGECPECTEAPGCSGAPAVPTESERLEEFDNDGESIYVTGVGMGLPARETDCGPAQLRIRLRQIKIVRNGHGISDVDLYCIITASDGFKSELFVTPRHTDIGDDHAPLVYEPLTSSFWGQIELQPTESNLTVTYQCFLSNDPSEYTGILEDISDAALDAGGVAGPYGWAFGLGSVAASIVGSVIGSGGGDELRLSVQQTIDDDAFLTLTNGRIWQIQMTGEGSWFEDWDWMLEVEAWGCADVRPHPD
jgi:hypothetical protein